MLSERAKRSSGSSCDASRTTTPTSSDARPRVLGRRRRQPGVRHATLRFEYTSLVAPVSSYDYDFVARSGRSSSASRCPATTRTPTSRTASGRRRRRARPVSIVHLPRSAARRDRAGAAVRLRLVEISIDPSFSVARVSLLERGVVFAIAHIRGGGELGRRWYEDGKLEHKPNTFSDFIACAEHLVAEGYTLPSSWRRGRERRRAADGSGRQPQPRSVQRHVAEVPFVDSLTRSSTRRCR